MLGLRLQGCRACRLELRRMHYHFCGNHVLAYSFHSRRAPARDVRTLLWLTSRMGWQAIAVLCAAAALAAAAAAGAPERLAKFRVIGDGIPDAIGGALGDPHRGRRLILARESANCVLCHTLPEPELRFSGNIGPPLAGVARTLSVAQLRLRGADNSRVNAATG